MLLHELENFVLDISDDEESFTQSSTPVRQGPDAVSNSHEQSGMPAVKRDLEVSPHSADELPCKQHKSHHTDEDHIEIGTEFEAGLCFEDDSSCDEFIPKGSIRTRSEVSLEALPAPKQRVQQLPSELRALIPAVGVSAPREVAAVGLLEEGGVASRALRFVARSAQPLSEAALPSLRKRLREWGYGGDCLDRLLAYIRDDAPIIIHIDLATRFDKLSSDTHYRNQFETRTTCGSSDLSKRQSWEDRLFPGVYENAAPKERVKYGVLNMVNDPCGIASVSQQYGKDYLVLRGVRLRTTFSDKDSCNRGELASCEWYAHVLAKYSDLELRAVMEVALGERLFVNSSVLDTSKGGYKEVQIHGELLLGKHIETIVVHPSRRGTPLAAKLFEWCAKENIHFEFMPDQGEAATNPRCRQIFAETPLWRWRPCGSDSLPWIRFNCFESSRLEGNRRSADTPSSAWPIGMLSSGNLEEMKAVTVIAGQEVELELERCTAGGCTFNRLEELGSSRGVKSCKTRKKNQVSWEWCASSGGDGSWTAYEDKWSSVLEKAFCQRASTVDICIHDVSYFIDLTLLVQINKATSYRRLIRRSQSLG